MLHWRYPGEHNTLLLLAGYGMGRHAVQCSRRFREPAYSGGESNFWLRLGSVWLADGCSRPSNSPRSPPRSVLMLRLAQRHGGNGTEWHRVACPLIYCSVEAILINTGAGFHGNSDRALRSAASPVCHNHHHLPSLFYSCFFLVYLARPHSSCVFRSLVSLATFIRFILRSLFACIPVSVCGSKGALRVRACPDYRFSAK